MDDVLLLIVYRPSSKAGTRFRFDALTAYWRLPPAHF